jgi:hypothetical protein
VSSVAVVFATAALLEAVGWASRSPGWRRRFLDAPRPVRWAVYYAGVAALLLYGNYSAQKFIYAQF